MIRSLSLAMTAPALWACSVSPLAAQEVMHQTSDSISPPAQLDQAAWLSGNWRGVSDEGDEVLESWVGPVGAIISGTSVEYAPARGDDEASNWSENMVIVPNGDSLALHNSNFDLVFGGYGYIEKRLLRIEDDGCQLYFDGVTFMCKRDPSNGEVTGMTVYWKEPPHEWTPQPELFTYTYTRIVAGQPAGAK